MKNDELIKVILSSPEGLVWEGEALSVTSENSEGIFDLFPDHTRFMTLLEKVDLVIRLPEETDKDEVFHIEKAVLLFQDATAKIYLHKPIDPEPVKV